MPNLASMKEEYQVSPFLRTESSAVTANSHIHPGSPQLLRPSVTWSGNLVGGKVGWSWEQRFYLQGLLGR